MPFIKPVYANCPVCILTVGGGLIIAKKLGIDDLLVAIWISGLNTAIGFWAASSIKKKILSNPILWSLTFFTMAIIYLSYTNQLGHANNKLWGIDKVFLGMTIGLLTFFVAVFIDKLIRYKNKGKVLFNYQKVIIPVTCLSIITILFNFLI